MMHLHKDGSIKFIKIKLRYTKTQVTRKKKKKKSKRAKIISPKNTNNILKEPNTKEKLENIKKNLKSLELKNNLLTYC